MNFRGYVFLFLAVIFQAVVAWRLGIFAAAPDLLLGAVIAMAVLGNFGRIWPVFFGGLILDFLTGRIFGVFILAFLFCFVSVFWLAQNVLKKNNVLPVIFLSAVGVFIFELSRFFLFKIGAAVFSNGYIFPVEYFFGHILPISLALNAALAALTIFLFNKWNFFPKNKN